MPALTGWFRARDLQRQVWFHISDEPKLENIAAYQRASDSLRPLLEGFRTFDALNDYRNFETVVRQIKKSGKHFQNGQLVRAAEPYFIYRRAKQVSLRAADGRGPIVATADGECAPKEQITVQVQPLAGRILLPKPAFERFAAQRTAQSADRT